MGKEEILTGHYLLSIKDAPPTPALGRLPSSVNPGGTCLACFRPAPVSRPW
jgi:hypothetical protein